MAKSDSWERRQNLKQGESELEQLVAFDYEVFQFSEYHFRINNRLDVWPSTHKWYDTRNKQKGMYKGSLFKFVKEHTKTWQKS